MNTKALIAALVAAALLTGSSARAQGKLTVITATEDLAAIAREVGGDRVSVEAIARGYQDPHFVEAKPSFILKLQKADVLIVVGRELEIGWLPPLIQQSRNAKIQPGADGYVDASLQAEILEVPTGQVTARDGRRASARQSALLDGPRERGSASPRRVARQALAAAAERPRGVRPESWPISRRGSMPPRSGGSRSWRRTRPQRW